MKKFLIRGFFYSIPLLFIILLIYIIDPYYLFTSKDLYNKTKFQIGYSYDQGRRYKIFTFKNKPETKIVLGASEINVISEHNIPEQGWHSLSYGGAPLQESLHMYWVISQEYNLNKVILAPEFIKFFNAISSGNGDSYYANFNWLSSQSKKALDIYNNKLDYFIDKYTLKSTFKYLISLFYGEASVKSIPTSSKEHFWNDQLDYAHKVYNENIIFPEKISEVKDLFKKIKQDADKKNIEIIIILPVQHVDLLKKEFHPSIFEIYKNYIKSLTEIFGKVYYLAYANGYSDNDAMFSDPFHCISSDIYLENIFKKDSEFIITPEFVDEKLDSVMKILYPNE